MGTPNEAQTVEFVTLPNSETTLTLTAEAPQVVFGWIAGHRKLELVHVRSQRGNESTTMIRLPADGTRVWLLDKPLVLAPGSHPLTLIWRSGDKQVSTEIELLWARDQRALVQAVRAVG